MSANDHLLKGLPGSPALQGDLVVTDTDQSTALFTVAAASGNVTAKGTITQGSAGQFTSDASGNVVVGGTLGVTGASTFTGALRANGNIGIGKAPSANLDVSGDIALSGTLYGGTALRAGAIETGLTAHAGGGQGSALALSAAKVIHVVTTVGTAADSVVLPAATGTGAVHFVSNQAAANSMQLFGTGTDTVNGAASGTGIAVAAKKTAVCVDYAAGTWLASVSA